MMRRFGAEQLTIALLCTKTTCDTRGTPSTSCRLFSMRNNPIRLQQRRQGTIKEWHPFERRGVVVEVGTGSTFVIPNTRAFETVLPTAIRDLVGAHVSFQTIASEAANIGSGNNTSDTYANVGTDRVIIRRKSDEVNASTYRRPPPKVDLLAAFRVPITSDVAPPPASPAATTVGEDDEELPEDRLPWQKKRAPAASATPQVYFASDILIDLTTLPSATPARQKEDSERSYLQHGMPPASHLKDLRTSTLLNAERLTKMRTLSGVPTSATTENAADQIGEAQADGGSRVSSTTPNVTSTNGPAQTPAAVIKSRESSLREGTVVAWSALHRTGLIVVGSTSCVDPQTTAAVSAKQEGVYVIRNVDAFQSAMPSSMNLVSRMVHFVAVTYSNHPGQTFAEDIMIQGPIQFDNAAVHDGTSPESMTAMKETAKKERFKALVLDAERYSDHHPSTPTVDSSSPAVGNDDGLDADAWYKTHVPSEPVYGVLTRWSGGQGIIEIGGQRTYFVSSAAEFQQLVEASSSHIRGAVVTFEVDAKEPRYAKKINILTLSSATSKPLPQREPQQQPVESQGATAPIEASWLSGFLVSYSKEEGQGVIQCDDDGHRYLLRDASEHVVKYKSHAEHLLSKGRRVKFCRMGTHGHVASNVVVEAEEADAEALERATLSASQKEATRNVDGNMDEAVASPLSTGYWMTKLERAGFDVSEVKKRQQNILPPDLNDDDDQLILDTKDLYSKDRWFNDKDRNIKLPGSDMRVGDISQMTPTAMVNLAAKIQSPAKLEKMKDKYFNQLTEEMKAHAWQQAKEMAPRYGQRLRDAKAKGEEPTFHFY